MTLQKTVQCFTLALLFLYGCGGNEPKSPPSRSKTLKVRLESPVSMINPMVVGTGYPRYVANNVFQTLSAMDPKTIEMKPLLVKNIPSAVTVADGKYKGNLSYAFELMDAAKWDNGTPVTAADVEFSLKIILNPLANTKIWRGYFDRMTGFEIDPANPKKFTFYLRDYYILGLESITQFPIYPIYNYDPNNLLKNIPLDALIDPKNAEKLAKTDKNLQDFATAFNQPATGADLKMISGSGPYSVSFLDPAQGVLLVRKKDWWGDQAVGTNPFLVAYPDSIDYRLATAEDAAINMLRSGDLDLAANIAPVKFLELQKDADFAAKFELKTFWMPAFNRVLLNHRDPILADKRVRQALSYAINYDEILTDIQHGMAERTIGPINPNNPAYAKNIALYTLNIDKAKSLLAEAGWTDSDNDGVADKKINGKKTDLVFKMMNTTGTPVADQISAFIPTSMAKAGIKIEVVVADLPTITKETMAGNYQLATTASAWHPGTIDFYQVYHSDNILPGDNRSGFANAEMDQLINAIRGTESFDTRKPMYIRAQEILHDEVPEIFLYAPVTRLIISKNFNCDMTALRPGYQENQIQPKK